MSLASPGGLKVIHFGRVLLVLTVLESGDILGIYGHNGTNYHGKYILSRQKVMWYHTRKEGSFVSCLSDIKT